MASRARLETYIDDPELRDTGNWPTVDETALSSRDLKKYRRRKTAVIAYMKGIETVKYIAEITNIHEREIQRLTKRCLMRDKLGDIYGFRALISHKHVKPYERTTDSSNGFAGKLTQLFNKYPEIKKRTENSYLGKRKRGEPPERQKPLRDVHREFLDLCSEFGVSPNEWPFDTETQGRESLRKYLKSLYDTRQREAVHGRHGESNARVLDSSKAKEPHSLVRRPFARVQFDATRVNAFMTITLLAPDGAEIDLVLERIWLLTIIDVASRAILGYHISLNRNYSMEDVMQTFANAITPWKAHKLTIPNLAYLPHAGLPSGVIPSCSWRLFDQLSFDNALAHLSPWLQKNVSNVIGCAINPGKAGTPEARGIVEAFFKTISQRGFNRLPSTTGGNPKDSRRFKAEEAAVRFKIRLSEIEELIDVLIANYNVTRHEGVLNRTPLEYIKNFENSGSELVRTLPESKREAIPLFEREYIRTVRGRIDTGRRPYIQFENVRYSCEVLAGMPSLVNTELRLVVNIKDLRFIKAFLPDGSALGVLRASAPWNNTPHSLKIRQAIFKLERLGEIDLNVADPITAYRDLLTIKSRNSKRHRNELAKVQKNIHQFSSDDDGLSDPIPMANQEHLKEIDPAGDWSPRQKHWIKVTKTVIG